MKNALKGMLSDRTMLLAIGTAIVAIIAAGFSVLSVIAALLAIITGISGAAAAGDAYAEGLIDGFFDAISDDDDIKIGGTD